MKAIFITRASEPIARWIEAFPQLTMAASTSAAAFHYGQHPAAYFLDADGFSSESVTGMLRKLNEATNAVAVLSGNPSEQEAFTLIAAGARGYCHVAAPPKRLVEVASAVVSGQLWLPPGMIQNFIKLSQVDMAPSKRRDLAQVRKVLTRREMQVALAVGEGASNKEIAQRLSITERTVKARLTSSFAKLGVRDRVQLALAVNRPSEGKPE